MIRLHNVEDVYPLSPTQQGLLFHTLYDTESPPYLEQVVLRIWGELAPAALEQAWQFVVNRHSALRAAFMWESLDEPLQVVRERVNVPLPVADWPDVEVPSREARLHEFLRAERARGFDLSQAPLLRLHLLRLGPADHWLVWSFHHLLIDGWSISLVLREVLACYEAFRGAGSPDLPPPPSYAQYIGWLQSQDMAAAEEHWRAALAGFRAPTPLVVDREPAGLPEFAERPCSLGRDATAALTAMAREQRLTLNVIAVGAWALLLNRYSGEDDIVVGVTLAGRPPSLPRAEEMVGVLINTLPLRIKVDASATVAQWLADLQRQMAELLQHQATPLPKIHAWSEVPRGTSLFQSLVVFENYPLDAAVRQPDSGAQMSLETIFESTNYPVTLIGAPGDNLSFRMLYDGARLGADAAERLLAHYTTLLAGIGLDPRCRIRDLPLLPPAEAHRLLAEWAHCRADWPSGQTVHGIFHEQAVTSPEAIAVSSGDRRLSYAALERQANQLAHYLRGRGIGTEMPVGIALQRSPELVVALLGVLKAGGCYVPLDPDYPSERLAFMLADCGATITLTCDALRHSLPSGSALVSLDEEAAAIAACPATPPDAEAGPENLAYIMYTSGSTGRPKGIEIPHRGVVRLVRGGSYCSFAPDEVFLLLASVSFDLLTFEAWGALLNGARLAVYSGDPLDLDGLAATIRAEGVTTMWLTSGLFNRVVTHRLDALAPVRQLLAGGDVLSPPHVRTVLENLPACRLVNGYGPTENTTFASCHQIRDCSGTDSVPIGMPIENSYVYVLDRDMRPVPIGVPGELYMGGQGLARAYLNRQALTAEKFVPDPFSEQPGARLYKSGDLVRWNALGVLEFLGRMDGQVKIRGFRVEPAEIETVLRRHPDVRDALVVPEGEGADRRRLVAYVTPKAAAEIAGLRAFLRERLPEYMVPARIVLLDSFPLTPNGKLDRSALAAVQPAAPTAGEFVAPRSEAEQALARIWADVLGVERVGIHDNFLDLGGDSILSIQVVARANEEGLRISPRLVFQHPTVAELAAMAGHGEVVAPQEPVVGPVPLTPIQHWFFEQDFAQPQHWNQSLLLRSKEPLDTAVVTEAVNALMAHHDALRMRFAKTADGWQQECAAPADMATHLGEVQVSTAGEFQASVDLSRGPLLRMAVMDQDDERRLLLVAHHLIVDAVSWHILLKDLDRAYRQLRAGDQVRLPAKTTSYRDWAIGLQPAMGADMLRADLAFWQSLDPAIPLPRDADGENTEGLAEHVAVSFGVEETRALCEQAGHAYRMRVDEILLAALAPALARWTGSGRVGLTLETHGRDLLPPGADLTRTVGWFTGMFPLILEISAADGPMQSLIRTKEQFRSIAPHGAHYGALRYLRPQGASLLPLPEISFNYLGHLDAGWHDLLFEPILPGEAGAYRSPQARRPFPLEINGVIHGGRLEAVFIYSSGLHRRETIQHVAEDFAATLRCLIAHCLEPGAGRYTPADFPEAGVQQEELDKLLTIIQADQS